MVTGLISWEPFLHFTGSWERDDIHLDTIKSIYHSQMETTPSITEGLYHYAISPVVKPFPRLRQHLIKVPKLQTIPEESEEPDTFEPFGSNYPLSWHTLSCFCSRSNPNDLPMCHHHGCHLPIFQHSFHFPNHQKTFHQAQESITSRTRSNAYSTYSTDRKSVV